MMNLRNQKRVFSKTKVMKEMEAKLVRAFLDQIILSTLREKDRLDSDEIVKLMQNKLNGLLSLGIVYSSLEIMVLRGLINDEWVNDRHSYTLTNKGKRALDVLIGARDKITEFIQVFLYQY